MKHLITIDSLFQTLEREAQVQGAAPIQLHAVMMLEQTSEKIDDEYNPYRLAKLDVEVVDSNLRICISETDGEGNVVANGEWCRIRVDCQGTIHMTTSHEPEFIHVMELE